MNIAWSERQPPTSGVPLSSPTQGTTDQNTLALTLAPTDRTLACPIIHHPPWMVAASPERVLTAWGLFRDGSLFC